MNPCPCGYFGSDMCRCKDADVKKYQKNLSGPIVDRIDLQVELERLSTEERFAPAEEDVSPRFRQKIETARQRQTQRYAGKGIPFNAAIPGGMVMEYCDFGPEALAGYKEIINKNTLTTRSMDRLAKVARTIADLEGSTQIQRSQVQRASSYVVGGILRDQF
jgi:magnesium chelatase family protein